MEVRAVDRDDVLERDVPAVDDHECAGDRDGLYDALYSVDDAAFREDEDDRPPFRPVPAQLPRERLFPVVEEGGAHAG